MYNQWVANKMAEALGGKEMTSEQKIVEGKIKPVVKTKIRFNKWKSAGLITSFGTVAFATYKWIYYSLLDIVQGTHIGNNYWYLLLGLICVHVGLLIYASVEKPNVDVWVCDHNGTTAPEVLP